MVIQALDEYLVQIDDCIINYVHWGDGTKHILLVPGGLGTWKTDFGEAFIQRFDPHVFNVVVADPPGYGKSRPPNREYGSGQDNHSRRDARVLAKLMKELNMSPFNVMGWSEGARVALWMGRDHPDDVCSIVEWGGIVSIDYERRQGFAMAPGPKEWLPHRRELFVECYGGGEDVLDYMEKIWKKSMKHYQEIYDKHNGNLCIEILPFIKMPLLVIDMEHDNGPEFMRKESKRIAEMAPRGCHQFHKGSKHDIHRTHSDYFVMKVTKFILYGYY